MTEADGHDSAADERRPGSAGRGVLSAFRTNQ